VPPPPPPIDNPYILTQPTSSSNNSSNSKSKSNSNKSKPQAADADRSANANTSDSDALASVSDTGSFAEQLNDMNVTYENQLQTELKKRYSIDSNATASSVDSNVAVQPRTSEGRRVKTTRSTASGFVLSSGYS